MPMWQATSLRQPRAGEVELPRGRNTSSSKPPRAGSVTLNAATAVGLSFLCMASEATSNWLFNIDALAEKATVYALDLPGHGQSSKTIAEPSLAGLSHALVGLTDALGIANAHIVGHSVGGAVAMQTALDAPDRVKSLTLMCSAGLGPEINSAYIDGYVKATSRRDLRPVLERLFADPKLVSRQLVDDALKYKRIDGVAEALRRPQLNLFEDGKQRTNLAPLLRHVACPVLVIWGEQDDIIPASHAHALADKARAEIVPSAGHMVQMEKARSVNELILAHIGA
jgi:pyruvate dehydrogenase E2 component (dihydrolipoamide acetyltransferase)